MQGLDRYSCCLGSFPGVSKWENCGPKSSSRKKLRQEGRTTQKTCYRQFSQEAYSEYRPPKRPNPMSRSIHLAGCFFEGIDGSPFLWSAAKGNQEEPRQFFAFGAILRPSLQAKTWLPRALCRQALALGDVWVQVDTSCLELPAKALFLSLCFRGGGGNLVARRADLPFENRQEITDRVRASRQSNFEGASLPFKQFQGPSKKNIHV